MIVEEENPLFSEAKETCFLGFLSFVPFLLGVGKCGGSACERSGVSRELRGSARRSSRGTKPR